jgi:hypothetical protein
MSLLEKLKEFKDKQAVAKMRHEAALENKERHENIQKEREFNKKQQVYKSIIGEITPEEKKLLKAREERMAKYAENRRAVLVGAGHGAVSIGKGAVKVYRFFTKATPGKKRHKRRWVPGLPR